MGSVDAGLAWSRVGDHPTVLRFGVFDANIEAGELRKSGTRIHLTGQPFQVLVLLLERDGDIVTREELRQVLWPDGTVVDFDRCLNTVINKLRETLGDSAETPRFVETIPRRGYRFLLPVQREVPEPPATLEAPATAATPPSPATAQSPTTLPPPAEPQRAVVSVEAPPAPRTAAASHGSKRTAGAMMLMVAILGALALWRFWPAPARDPSFALLPLTQYAGSEITPSLSPDGSQVAFAWNGESRNDLNLYVCAVGSSEPLRLTNTPNSDFSPSYAPAGDQIAFYRRSGDAAAIYLVSPRGGTPVRLMGLHFGPPDPMAKPTGFPEPLSWSPDGKYLAFVDRPSPQEPYSVYLRSIESRDDRCLTWPPADAYGDGSPALSPDGRNLAFVRRGADGSADIYLTSLVEGGLRQITAQGCPIFGLTWHPDGTRLVYSSGCNGPPTLWAAPLTGETPRRFAAAVGEDVVEPSLSRAGGRLTYVRRGRGSSLRRLAFTGSARGGDAPLLGAKLEGLPPRAITAHYSPSGKRIVFARNHAGQGEIWTASSEGSDSTLLTSLPALVGSPNWSPDGKRIIFDSMAGGNWDIYRIDAQGGEPLRLTTHEGMDVRPSWSRDGQWIYFSSDRSGASQIWKARPDGSGPVRLTEQGGYEAYESLDGASLYYTRRSISGLWKVAVSGGDETLEIPDLPWEQSRCWTITRQGIVYTYPLGDSSAVNELRLFDPASGSTRPLLTLDGRLEDAALSISPDNRWFLYSQNEESETDIEVMENLP